MITEHDHSDYIMEQIEFWVEGVLSTIVGTVGVLGNISALSYFRKRLRGPQSTFYGLMIALAIYDLIIIISLIPLMSIPNFSSEFGKSRFYQNFMATWTLFIAHVGLEGSIYLTMAISIERYLVICHPLRYRISSWPTKAFVIPIACFSIIYSAPKLYEVETRVVHQLNHVVNYTKEEEIPKQCLLQLNLEQQQQQQHVYESYQTCALWFRIKFGSGAKDVAVPDNCTHARLKDLLDKLLTSTTISIVPTQLRQNPCYYQIYIVWLNVIFNGIGPFLVLIILNAFILRHLVLNERRGSSRRTSPGSSSGLRIHHHENQKRKRETKVAMAKVSLAIVFVFIICHSIRWIPNVYEFFWVRLYKIIIHT